MKKPVIGVMPLYDDERDSLWMVPGYFDGLAEAGAVPLMLPLDLDEAGFRSISEQIDGYLFTGGHDVNPALYGESPVPQDELFCDRRDRLEKMVFDYCFDHDVPALGICRGIQFFNVMRGGSLWQDIPSQYQEPASGKCAGGETVHATPAESNAAGESGLTVPETLDSAHGSDRTAHMVICHSMTPPYAEHHAEHMVTIANGSPLHILLGENRIRVNSYHHQAVKRIGDGLVPQAWSDDGLVESLYAPDRHFLLAVQWHPEFTFREDENSRKIFEALVESCK